jgi:hypothetical protein
MDPELKKLLEENLRVAQENNQMLSSMRKQARWGLIGRIVLWALFVIAPLIFLWGYLGPLMNAVNGNFGSGGGFNSGDFQNLINQYQGK